jgi:putative oxidoreductase
VSVVIHNFDLTQEFNILRIACGLFLLPHFYAKITNLPGTMQLYRDFRLSPPMAWAYASMTIELVALTGLIFGIYTHYAAALAAIFLLAAAIAVFRHSGGKWHWNAGGGEYCLFWAICCGVVAMHTR